MLTRNLPPNGQQTPRDAAAALESTVQSSGATAYTTFDDLVASYRMPPPGPEYYRARRQLWLTPRPDKSRNTSRSQHVSTSRTKLEKTLQTPGAVYSDSSWRSGIEKVWKGLSRGECLKYRLPLSLIVCPLSLLSADANESSFFIKIKVVHASWVRDETWPMGMQAPEPDDELPDDHLPEPMVLERIGDPKPSMGLPLIS